MIKSYTEVINKDSSGFIDIIVPVRDGHVIILNESVIGDHTLIAVGNERYYVPRNCNLYNSIKEVANRKAEFLLLSIKINEDDSIERKAGGNMSAYAVTLAMDILIAKTNGDFTLEPLSKREIEKGKECVKNLSSLLYENQWGGVDLSIPMHHNKFMVIQNGKFGKCILILSGDSIYFIGIQSKVLYNIMKVSKKKNEGSDFLNVRAWCGTSGSRKECIRATSIKEDNHKVTDREIKLRSDIVDGIYGEYKLMSVEDIEEILKPTKLVKDKLLDTIDEIDKDKDLMIVMSTDKIDD